MRTTICLILALLSLNALFSQEINEEKKEPMVKFSGHIRYEAYFDSYESVSSREGDFYLYPVRQSLNLNGDDIKHYPQLTMLSAQSRLRAKMNGPDAFGAKVNGMIEIDFLGKAGITSKGDAVDFVQTPRIRHMFMNLDWGKTQLTMGQTWHPIFVTECFPDVLGMGAGLPFNPLSRAPQIKVAYLLTDKIELSTAALYHLDMMSSGPTTAQKNASIPDFQGSVKYKTDKITTGIVGGYKILKPRTVTETNQVTSKRIGSFEIAGFGKIAAGDLTIKAFGIYGGNLSAFTMIGGYGAAENNATVDDYSYSNIMTMAAWTEAIYKWEAFQFGIFGGYSANLSSSKEHYYSLGYARGENINNIYRISPRVAYTSGKIQLGLEYMLTGATYVDLGTAGTYESTSKDKPVKNNRIYFSATYSF